MNTDKHHRNFWFGNAVLALDMLLLIFMGPLSDAIGVWGVVLWMVLAAAGVALMMSGKQEEPPAPD